MATHPDLAGLRERQKALKAERSKLKKEIAKVSLRLINENLPEDIEETFAGSEFKTPFEAGDLEFTEEWTCDKSPTGFCVYHPESDPGDCDSCIYCHDPLERQ